jgi:hypothetical protein
MTQYSLPIEVLEQLQAGNLFYPSSGSDLATPIEVFSTWLSDFWFVDSAYTGKPLLRENPHYQLIDSQYKSLQGTTMKRGTQFEVEVYHETYERKQDQRRITIHQCRGRGYDAFRIFLKSRGASLSVFFYRGDSQGEGGSGFYWLKNDRLRNVLEVLEDGGLIVSDGSNAICQLSTFHRCTDLGRMVLEKVQPFTFANRRFECIGYLGERYGPTLVWQVKKV